MNILILRPTLRYLHYGLVNLEGGGTLCQGRVPSYRASDNGLAALRDIGDWCAASAGAANAKASTDDEAIAEAGDEPVGETAASTTADAVDAVALCAPYGGERFGGPVPVTDDVLADLHGLEEEAPMHVPLILAVADASRRAFADSPLVLVFGTAFFTGLPPRERSYAVDPAIVGRQAPRRYGFHGLYHDAASRFLRDRLREQGVERGPLRIVSVCLEPRPEVAAVQGRWPVMVTSGATPLEGLPGDTTCGELDPQIPILLAQRLAWGGEEINRVLTRESGLAGLAGPGETLLSVCRPGADPALSLARDVVRYRLLQACGAAIAALGGADGLVFSGHYLGASATLGPWLSERLGPRGTQGRTPLPWMRFSEPLDHVVAQIAALALRNRVAVPTDQG